MIVISALFYPDGNGKIHRFGDPQVALPEHNELAAPEDLLPENGALQDYLYVYGRLPIAHLRDLRQNVLTPKTREAARVTRYASTKNGLPSGPRPDQDSRFVLQVGQRALFGSDGLLIYPNLPDRAQARPGESPKDHLARVHRWATYESTDNMNGFAIQRSA